MSVPTSATLREIIGPRTHVRSVFQPIVDLERRQVVGYEALARFPDAPDLTIADVFARARDSGALADLDWECRRAAYEGAVAAELGAPHYLFVNVEPSVLGSPPPWPVDPTTVAEFVTAIPTVIELTERSLFTDPRSVLAAMDWARSQSCLVALDDVGANPDSVSMLDIVRPDVIKLDRSLLADVHSDDQLRTLRAVWDHVAHSGAHILCEGVETERDLDRARGCGATLVQGYHLGRPGPLSGSAARSAAIGSPTVLGIATENRPPLRSDPTTLLHRGRVRVSPVREIAQFGAGFDASRAARPGGCVLLSLHDPQLYTSRLQRRYAELATTNSLVAVIGVGEDVAAGVRGSLVQPIRDHFAYVSLDSNFSMAIVARDLGDDGPIPERRFEWVLTWDHDEVTDVARNLLRRLPSARVQVADAQGPAGDLRPSLVDIVTTVVRGVVGAESVGLTLRTPTGGLQTLAASDQYPFLIDQLQERYAEGPSLEGVQRDPVMVIADFARDGRWMSFRAAATIAAPIASVLSFRLFSGPGGTGFLTLYSQEANAFDDVAVRGAHALARYVASVWVRLRSEPGGEAPDALELDRTDFSDLLDAATGQVALRERVSPLSALRSIVDVCATTGSSLQQTAEQMMEPTGSTSTTIPASDFGSAAPS